MTRRNRASSRPARLTWVNHHVPWPRSLADGSVEIRDLLGSAEVFQKFDSTIVKIIGTFYYTFVKPAVGISSEDFELLAYMYVADEGLAVGNFPLLTGPATQAAYLWTHVRGARLTATLTPAGDVQIDPSVSGLVMLDIGAQRRFRENNKTLWLHVQNSGGTGQSVLWGAYIRTLVRIS